MSSFCGSNNDENDYELGAREERQAIVKWLRMSGWHPSWLGSRLGIAQMLEDGKHLAASPPSSEEKTK